MAIILDRITAGNHSTVCYVPNGFSPKTTVPIPRIKTCPSISMTCYERVTKKTQLSDQFHL